MLTVLHLAWIQKNRGMIVVNTHPDPFYGGKEKMFAQYRAFLEKFRNDPKGFFALARDVVDISCLKDK